MATPNPNPTSGLGAFFQELEQMFHDTVPENLQDLPSRIFDSLDKLTGEVYEAVNAFGPPSISLPMPPFLSIEDGAKTISVPRAPLPPPTFYDRLAKYASDHPYVLTSGALSVAALAVGLGYSLQDEDSFLRVKSRDWMESRGTKDKDGKSGYKLGSESGSSFLAGLRGGKPHHAGFLQRRADRLKGRKVDGVLKDAILILAPSPFPQLLLQLILSLLNNDYIVFIAVPKSKDADELEKKIKLNEKVKAKGLSVSVRVMVYDPAESESLEPFQRSLWASLTLRYPSSSLSFTPSGRATHPPGDPYAPEPTHLASLHSIISLYALHPSPDPSLGSGGRLPAIPSFIHPPSKNSAGQLIDRSSSGEVMSGSRKEQLPSLITLHHTLGLLPIPSNFAEQLLTTTNRLLAKNVGIANPAMRITNVGIGEIDYYSSIAAHSFTESSSHGLEPGVMNFLRPIWSGFKLALGMFGLGEQAGDWKVVERKLLWIVKKKHSGEYNVGSQTLLASLFANGLRPTFVSLLLKYTDFASLLPSIQRIGLSAATSASTSAGSSATFTTGSNKPLQPAAASVPPFTPSTTSFPGSASGSDGAEVDSSEFETSSHTGTGTASGNASLSGSGYVGMDGSWVGLDKSGVPLGV